MSQKPSHLTRSVVVSPSSDLKSTRTMKFPTLLVLVTITSASHALADRSNAYAGLQPRSGGDGRLCDFTDGYYVDWSDCSLAAAKWCSAHAGQEVTKGNKIDDGNVAGYRSGHWNVELYGNGSIMEESLKVR